jgi:hypothetical protein
MCELQAPHPPRTALDRMAAVDVHNYISTLSGVSQNDLKFYQQLTGGREEDPFHFWSEQSVMF